MKKIFLMTGIILISLGLSNPSFADEEPAFHTSSIQEHIQEKDQQDAHLNTEGEHAVETDHHKVSPFMVLPFIMLLLIIATGPLFYEHFWHKNYPYIAIGFAVVVVGYYLIFLENVHSPIHALAEYVQFISLLAALYIASGGIMIKVDTKSTPIANVILLCIGAVIANLIGTTGASMLLIRPYIRLNNHRIKAFHIIFFIFMVSNIGGSLTPIGDPPLFLGFLKGVPFFWTLVHNILSWLVATLLLGITFYFFDKKSIVQEAIDLSDRVYSNKIKIRGKKNFIWLAIVIGAVFLDPNIITVEWFPAIEYDGQRFSFLRELIMLSVAVLSFKLADKQVLRDNEFNFEPIREVAFIFIGIFGSMMPALEMVSNFAQSDVGSQLITHNTLFWGTGMLSGFLDNAPTYLNFLAAALASQGGNINNIADVMHFAHGGVFHDSILDLKAISIASVFFGAMTYIGNGPNFMVKSISEQTGIKMPSFFGYIIRFSIPILLPLLLLTWLVFFAFV